MNPLELKLHNKDRIIASLKKAVLEINDKSSRAARREIISFILDSNEFNTEEDRKNVIDILTNSNISIDSIKQTYSHVPTRAINSKRRDSKHSSFYN